MRSCNPGSWLVPAGADFGGESCTGLLDILDTACRPEFGKTATGLLNDLGVLVLGMLKELDECGFKDCVDSKFDCDGQSLFSSPPRLISSSITRSWLRYGLLPPRIDSSGISESLCLGTYGGWTGVSGAVSYPVEVHNLIAKVVSFMGSHVAGALRCMIQCDTHERWCMSSVSRCNRSSRDILLPYWARRTLICPSPRTACARLSSC